MGFRDWLQRRTSADRHSGAAARISAADHAGVIAGWREAMAAERETQSPRRDDRLPLHANRPARPIGRF